MPENRETRASGLVAENGFRIAQAADADLTLEHLVCDASSAEAEAPDASERAKLGLPYVMDASSTVLHGSKSHQTPVYPTLMKPPVHTYPPTPYPPYFQNLVLRGVQSTHRALILNLGTLFLMVQYLTHTSVQWYPRDRWDTGIMSVSKDPTWEDHVADFSIPPNTYTATSDFLLLVSNWIEKENFLAGQKHVLACNAIRSANKVWYGIGVYTVMELFFMAGLSPFLTVCELFSSPSRTARFLAAFYTYIDHGESNLWALLQPCIHEGVLAPTTEQRLRYMDWLYVWAKDRVFMSRRMSQLLDDFHLFIQQFSQDVLGKFASDESTTCRGDVDDLYDVFEPTLVEPALQAHPNFGSLIFGEPAWAVMGDPHLLIVERRRCGLLLGTSLQVCTGVVYQHHPVLRTLSLSESGISMLPAAQRNAMLFKSIVQNTQGVSIGPLEYCGNGHIVHVGNIPWQVIHKSHGSLKNVCFVGLIAPPPNSRRQESANTVAVTKKIQIWQKLSTLDAGYLRVCGAKEDEDKDCADASPVKPKKRRLSADQKLALHSHQN
ncbi:hypothetical protein B0H10DRAFT_2201437 [Mycena sp. CBHHK59/15]|nr:hypothetical protein B0H10DRAFT_2201437 [Mycena sp. CBHHK59/15]